jgi:xylose isomerase
MSKLAIISGFLGSVKNRYMTYQEDRPLAEKFRMASNVEHLDGLELCYPQDFGDPQQTKALLSQHGLGVSAINFRSRRTGRWLRGSFSSQIATERREVVEDLKKAIRFAEELGCNRVTTCPLNEGHDYPFEMDYNKAFDFFEETIREAASCNPRVRICLEYKWNDPRARCLLGNAGETLAFCQRVGMPNVGVTLDFGHSIQAGERPAQSAVMLARENRLFYVHLNDNDKIWDWDMIPGAYNFWDLIEFLYYLRKLGYDDWFAYDVCPKEIDTVQTFNVVTNTTRKLMEISNRLDPSKVEELLAQRNPADSVKYLYSIL